MQGPGNQAQGPAVQNQALSSPNNNAQVSQNVPVQPPNQLAPAQSVPAGLVVPTPQVFYQNWIGKKPELKLIFNTWAIQYSLETKEYV